MRYKNGCTVSVPFVNTLDDDGNTERCWAHLTFRGDVDLRRVKRQVRKWVRSSLGRSLSQIEERMILRRIRHGVN